MASDIDIIIAVQNQSANAALQQTERAAAKVGGAAEGSAKGLGDMSTNFGRMSGILSRINPELGAMAYGVKGLAALANPVTLLATALGAAAYGTYKLWEAAESFEKADLAAELAKIHAQAAVTQGGFTAMYDAIIEGKDKTSIALAILRGEAQANFTEEQKESVARVKSFQAEIDQIQETGRKKNAYFADFDDYRGSKTRAQMQKEGQDRIDFLRRSIAQVAGALVTDAKGLRDRKADEEAHAKALAKHLQFLKDILTYTNKLQEKPFTPITLNEVPSMSSLLPKDFFQGEGVQDGEYVDVGLSPDEAQQLQEGHQARFDLEEANANARKEIWRDYVDEVGYMLTQELGKEAFGAYVDGISMIFGATVSGSKLSAKAMKEFTRQTLMSLGERALGEALFAEAQALVHYAIALYSDNPKEYAAAATFQSAAAAMFGVAALFGGGAAAAGGSGGGGGGGGDGGVSGASGYGGGTTDSGPNVTINLIGTLDDRDAENLYNQLMTAGGTRRLN